MAREFRTFSGTANEELADLIARGLGVRLGASEVTKFPNGELSVQLLEPVRRNEVFIRAGCTRGARGGPHRPERAAGS